MRRMWTKERRKREKERGENRDGGLSEEEPQTDSKVNPAALGEKKERER